MYIRFNQKGRILQGEYAGCEIEFQTENYEYYNVCIGEFDEFYMGYNELVRIVKERGWVFSWGEWELVNSGEFFGEVKFNQRGVGLGGCGWNVEVITKDGSEFLVCVFNQKDGVSCECKNESEVRDFLSKFAKEVTWLDGEEFKIVDWFGRWQKDACKGLIERICESRHACAVSEVERLLKAKDEEFFECAHTNLSQIYYKFIDKNKDADGDKCSKKQAQEVQKKALERIDKWRLFYADFVG